MDNMIFLSTAERYSSKTPALRSLTNIDHIPITSSNTFYTEEENLNCLTVDYVTTSSISVTNEQTRTDLLRPNMSTFDSVSINDESVDVDERDLSAINDTSIGAESVYSKPSFISIETESSTDDDLDYLPMATDNNEEDEVQLNLSSPRRQITKHRSKRTRNSHRLKCMSDPCDRRMKSKINTSSQFPQIISSSSLFSNAFEELCNWLMSILNMGLLVSMNDIATEYRTIICRRQEKIVENMFRAASIRLRRQLKFGDVLHFEKLSNYDGPTTFNNNSHKADTCDLFLQVIEKLRDSIKSYSSISQTMKNDTSLLVNYDADKFWSCIPVVLKNFIGTLTLNDEDFASMKRNYEFYGILNEDLYHKSTKWLKIASSCYDIIQAQNQRNMTPKHYFLGNEVYRHERSEQLMTLMNRLGHTPSYKTVVRLHREAAQRTRESTDPFAIIRQKQNSSEYFHHFTVKVVDNFDINPDRVHGDNSIHILNQILISTPENDEIPSVAEHLLNEMLNIVELNVSFSMNSQQAITASPTTLFKRDFIDNCFNMPLLAYGLIKYSNDITLKSKYFSSSLHVQVPLISGFFATYLSYQQRPLHTVLFITPINEDPSSESTAEKCLEHTQKNFVDSNYQQQGVVVCDEKIYRSCVKVKRRKPDAFRNIFVYAGDFHVMKNMMIVIWDILQGSGIEDVIGIIYKGATLHGIFTVHHFNKSLRCCKLLYTALQTLWLEAFIDDNKSDVLIINCLNQLKITIEDIPSEFAKCEVSEKWFKCLLDNLKQTCFSTLIQTWTTNCITNNSTFRLWHFVLQNLLQPLLELYIAVRTCNFPARNAALKRFAPLFFSTNHRNYSRLCAQHLYDLQTCSSYLYNRLSNAFAVTRSNRRFSSIALDQTIECTINKYGKSKGGISGRLNDRAIDDWTNSFAFQALTTSNLHEICGLETDMNSIDSHVECAPNRKALDNTDLSIIIEKLRQENLFTMMNIQCRKILSGLVIHEDIVLHVTSLYERGEKSLSTFINDRLITKLIPIDSPIKAMPLLKIKNADTYEPNTSCVKKKGSLCTKNIKDFHELVTIADEEIRRTMFIAQQRNLKPLSQLFAHEFAPVPLSLCAKHNVDLFNQQSKAKIIDFLHKMYPTSFFSSCPISTRQSALVIDGGSLLEIKPQSSTRTIRDYAVQLLENNIGYLFKIHDRIDIVFDSIDSKKVKMFIKRHNNDAEKCTYQLKATDKLETPFSKFVHSNRAALAACVKECWMEPVLIQRLPKDRVLVVGGPDSTAIKLQNGLLPTPDYLLDSTHIEADSRIMLHINVISLDQQQKTVVIQATDTDIVLIAIAFSSSIILDQLIMKSFNTRTKTDTYINVAYIANDLRRRSIDPTVLLVLHAISGCDTTSFIRNITKKKMFQQFFNDPVLYSSINKLVSVPPPQEAVHAAEQLLIHCYSFDGIAYSLDGLRAIMAGARCKDRNRKKISSTLPPSTMAFYQHCLRASRQIKIWLDALDSHSIPPCMLISGYEKTSVVNQFTIKWTVLTDQPIDSRLDTCGDCKSNCTRCKCFNNNLSCTFYCKCNVVTCSNRNKNISSFDQFDDPSFDEPVSITESAEDDEVDDDLQSTGSYESNLNDENSGSESESIRNVHSGNSSFVNHDHSYCFSDSDSDFELEDLVTPKCRKSSSNYSNYYKSQPTTTSSYRAHVSPTSTTRKNNRMPSIFKTPTVPVRTVSRATNQNK